ncbi:MAG: DUF692 domain-containing protein [Hyphomicrobiales bacterium]|nr:DUF692 domain-containing protein [Hyphomicrobiales bacterium]
MTAMRATIPQARADRRPASAKAGVGLRFPHHRAFLEVRPAAGWLEFHSENYLEGEALETLEDLALDYPVSMHGVGLSLGRPDGIDEAHLARLVALERRLKPFLCSEHLAWGAVDHAFLADLLPFPLTRETLADVARNVDRAQQAFGRRLLVENPATYVQFEISELPEADYLGELVRRTGCGLICDVNNVFVSATNHGGDAEAYLRALPADAIGEYHLGGHEVADDGESPLLVDTHDRPVAAPVWDLYDLALRTVGPRPTLVERDAAIPPLEELLAEAVRAQVRLDAVSAAGPHVRVA